jgi:hypothetical protein
MHTLQNRICLLLGPILAFGATLAFTLHYRITLASDLLTACYLFCILAMYGLVGLYLRHVWKNNALNTGRKVLWTVLLVYTSLLMQLIYWFRYLRREA